MKRYSLGAVSLFVAVMAVMFAGCSSDRSGDVKELLKTVPYDASMVSVIDIEDTIDELGGKVKNGEVKLNKELVDKLGEKDNPQLQFGMDLLMNGGVDPSCCVLFGSGYEFYVTGFIADTDKFQGVVSQKFGESFQKEGEISTCGSVACTSNQFWFALTSRNTISAKDVKYFTQLSEQQCFISRNGVDYLIESDDCVRGWGDIKACMNAAGLDFTTKASMQMGLEALFSDAVEFKWDLDIDKDELDIKFTFLNSKGGVAAFLYPVVKVNPSEIENSGFSASVIAAMAISPKITERLKSDTGGKGISVLGMLSSMISAVDGTVVVAADKDSHLEGVIPVNSNATSDLVSLLSQYGMTVSREKDLVKFINGNVSGNLSAKEVGKVFKGSVGGLVMQPEKWTGSTTGYVAILLKPEKGGMQLEIKGKGLLR